MINLVFINEIVQKKQSGISLTIFTKIDEQNIGFMI